MDFRGGGGESSIAERLNGVGVAEEVVEVVVVVEEVVVVEVVGEQ